MVIKVLRDETFDPRGMMKPRWSRPFIIKKIMSRGDTRIIDLDGEEMFHPINRIESKNTTFKREKKKPTRLKTQKGGLGIN